MSRRRSLNRRWSRRSSINASAVLDQDSNYIDDEDDTYWQHLPDQTRYSNRPSLVESTAPILNPNSRIIDDSNLESTEWWNDLQKTSQDLLPPRATAIEAPNPDVANVSSSTSASGIQSITEEVKKKRVILGRQRKSSGKNPFSQVFNLSDVAVESEPISSIKRKESSHLLSRSTDEIGEHRIKRSMISSKNNSKYSSDSSSTDTERRVKARPLLFKRPKRVSSSTFYKILHDDDSIVGSSQPLNANKVNPDADASHRSNFSRSKELTPLRDKSLISEEKGKKRESVDNVNKTKEFNTQPRSPFDKIHSRSSRNLRNDIISESEGDEEHREISEDEEEQIFDKSDRDPNKSKDRESVTSVNKRKEFFSEIRSSLKKTKSTSLRKSKNDSISDSENEKMPEAAAEKGKKKFIRNSHKSKSSDIRKKTRRSDNDFQLHLSDGGISEQNSSQRAEDGVDNSLKIDDRTSPIRSRRSLHISSSSSTESISKTFKTKESNRLEKEVDDGNDDLSHENVVDISENIQDGSNFNNKGSETIHSKNRTKQSHFSNSEKSSTESLTESLKTGYKSSGSIQRNQINSSQSSYQNNSVNNEHAEEMELEESDEISNVVTGKSLHQQSAEESQVNDKSEEQSEVIEQKRISSNKIIKPLERQIIVEKQQNKNNEETLGSEEKENISNREIQKSLTQMKIAERSSKNNREESSFEKQRWSSDEIPTSSKQRKTQERSLTREDEEELELREEGKDLAGKTRKSSKLKRTREKQLTDDDENESESEEQRENLADKTQKSSKLRRTGKRQLTDKDESESENQKKDLADKTRKSSKLRRTGKRQLTDKDESESEKQKKDLADKTRKSLKQQELNDKTLKPHKKSVSSIRKSNKEDLEENSSVSESESLKRNNLNAENSEVTDPYAYELPSRNRSGSVTESDVDVHQDSIIVNNEIIQSVENDDTNVTNENLRGPSTSTGPLPSSSTNQRDKSINRLNPSKPNTLDRYFLHSTNRLVSQPINHKRYPGQTTNVPMSQEKLKELEDKLKKFKEKTDKVAEKEMAAAKERVKKQENAAGIKPKFPINKKNNKTPRPVNKAYIVNGEVYKQPKLPRPQKWATDRLYKFLWKKMEPKYDMDTRVKSEKFVKYLSEVVTVVKRRKKYNSYKDELDELIKRMARLGIIETRLEFHHFCYDFLPYEFRVKVTPMLMPGNVRNIPFDPAILTIPIIRKN